VYEYVNVVVGPLFLTSGDSALAAAGSIAISAHSVATTSVAASSRLKPSPVGPRPILKGMLHPARSSSPLPGETRADPHVQGVVRLSVPSERHYILPVVAARVTPRQRVSCDQFQASHTLRPA
jgi:hypothetical protein